MINGISRKRATGFGFIAILLWALLALFTVYTGDIPPFQLTAMSFGLAFVFALIKWRVAGDNIKAFLNVPPAVWVLGVGGLFGYHFFYFLALKSAPAAEAGLIAYLWPLLIVLFSALLPGERLRWFHVAGALVSLAGAGILITKGSGFSLNPDYMTGYLAALVCAFIWSGYSVLSRRYADISTNVIGVFCGATAVLALIFHLVFEQTVLPTDVTVWLAVVGLGLGPVGAAFFLWDMGVKKGDIQGLGVLSYLSPLLSTILLVAVGGTSFSWTLMTGSVLITLGAAIGSVQLFAALRQTKVARQD